MKELLNNIGMFVKELLSWLPQIFGLVDVWQQILFWIVVFLIPGIIIFIRKHK